MKNNKKKIWLKTTVLTLGLLGTFSQFQNCAAPGGGGAFVLGNGNTTQGSCVDANSCPQGFLNVGAVQPTSPISITDKLSGSAPVSSSDSTVVCAWDIMDSTGTTVLTGNLAGAFASGSCSLSNATAPATVGNFKLRLRASSAGRLASNSGDFIVQAGTVSNSGSVNNTVSSVVSNANKNVFSLKSHIMTSSATSSVVVGWLNGAVKTPFAGCSFNNVASGGAGADVNCPNLALANNVVYSLYVDVTSNGTSAVSCPSGGANSCLGSYTLDNTPAYGCLANQDANHPFLVSFFVGLNASYTATPAKMCWFGPAVTAGVPDAGNTKTAEFFNIPNLNNTTPPVAGLPASNWSAIISMQTSFGKASYSVTLTSDDGSYFLVNDRDDMSQNPYFSDGTSFSATLNNDYDNPHGVLPVNKTLLGINMNHRFDMIIFYRNGAAAAYLSLKLQ